jgi:hypothetical protein
LVIFWSDTGRRHRAQISRSAGTFDRIHRDRRLIGEGTNVAA